MEKAPFSRAKILVTVALAAALVAPAVFFEFPPAAPNIARAAGASFAFSPATVAVSSGAQFTVTLSIGSDVAVNAAQGIVTFPADRLRVVSVSKSGSILQFWSQEPSFSNAAGVVNFGGGLPSPGFSGKAGTVIRITFKATAPGAATVNVDQGAILANDGQGTNVLTNISRGVYTIGPEAPVSTAPVEVANRVTSDTHPDSAAWYNGAIARFAWSLPPDTDKVSYAFDQKADTVPSEAVAAVGSKEYSLKGLADGAWYFHVQLHTAGKWGSVLTKKIKVDRGAPQVSNIRSLTIDPTDPRPEFRWSASDDASAVAGYRVQAGGGEWIVPSPKDATGIVMPVLAPGKRTLTVEATDLAGNTGKATLEFEVAPIAPPVITEYPKVISQNESPDVAMRPVVIKGTAKDVVTVTVHLRKGKELLTLNAPVAADGSWEATYAGALGSGTWTLVAQAKDARGAMSFETAPVAIKVDDHIGDSIRFLAGWGAVGLVALFVVTSLVFAFLAAHARLRHYRLKLRKEILAAQVSFIKDFEQLEKDMDGRASKARQKTVEDMDALAKDIGKELERLKRDIG